MGAHRSRLISRSLGYALLFFLLGVAGSEAASATIFGTGVETEFVGDPTNYELGTYFKSSVAGEVTALRVYVGPVEAGNPGTIVGNLWDSSGNNLESATFSNIVAGWNEVALATPISISADTIYVVSANTNAGSTGLGAYAANSNSGSGFFGSGGFSNPPLTAISGDFGSPGTFPTQTYPSINATTSYFRDVEFLQFLAVPEPSSLLLVGLGFVGMFFRCKSATVGLGLQGLARRLDRKARLSRYLRLVLRRRSHCRIGTMPASS